MNGIADDHQFKTRSGWKYFHEIELEKDELYSWRFKKATGGFLNKSFLNNNESSTESSSENNNDVENYNRCFLKPKKKHFNLSNTLDLYHIKNNYIDTITTLNYNLPVALLYTDNYKDQYVRLQSVSEIYNNVNKCWNIATENDNSDSDFDDYQSMFGITEYYINSSSLRYNKQIWINLFYKLMPADFKLLIKDISTVSFTMPDTQKDEKWLIYAKRNGKEFWI